MAYEKTTNRIIELLQDNISPDFVTILDGDPIYIPTSMLPCVVVVKTDTITEDGPTGYDSITEQISIRVVFNMNDYMGASMTENIAHNKIVDAIEARKDSGEYEDDAIIGLIRKDYTLGNSIVGQKFDTKYDLLLENRSEEGVLTLEGHLNFITKQFVLVPTRV